MSPSHSPQKAGKPIKHRSSGLFSPPQAGGYPGKWVGRFIWDKGESIPFHYFLMFRKSFGLASKPKGARIHVAVADKYRLYDNGTYVGRGPCRSPGPDWTSFDTHDISHLLKRGRNAIAILAYYYGCPNNFSHDQRAGLFVQSEFSMPGGASRIVASDATWKVLPSSGWRRDVTNVSLWQGINTEIHDASRDPQDWMATDFDDSSWENAFVTSHENTWDDSAKRSCWSYLEPRITPLLRDRDITPVNVVTMGETVPGPSPSFTEAQ